MGVFKIPHIYYFCTQSEKHKYIFINKLNSFSFIYLFIYYLFIYLFICLFIYLFIYYHFQLTIIQCIVESHMTHLETFPFLSNGLCLLLFHTFWNFEDLDALFCLNYVFYYKMIPLVWYYWYHEVIHFLS